MVLDPGLEQRAPTISICTLVVVRVSAVVAVVTAIVVVVVVVVVDVVVYSLFAYTILTSLYPQQISFSIHPYPYTLLPIAF